MTGTFANADRLTVNQTAPEMTGNHNTAPTTELNERSHASRTAKAPESQQELHPTSHIGAHGRETGCGAVRLRQRFAGLQRAIGNQAVLQMLSHSGLTIQTKLTVNQPGDQYEQEADRVAEQVMRTPDPAVSQMPGAPSHSGVKLQRECACGGSGGECSCKDKHEEGPLQRKTGDASAVNEVPAIVHQVLRSPGQPLDSGTRAFFEPRLGHGLGQVRVHSDTAATQSALAVNALAYAVGPHVVFGPGQYAATTRSGMQVLAHELAHVIQQSGSARALPLDLNVGPPGDSAEGEADRIAEAAIRSEPPQHPAGSQGPGPDLAPQVYLGNGDIPLPTDPFPWVLRRKVIVNPPAATGDILSQFNFLCPGNFSVSGQSITENCVGSTNQSCDCLCDVAGDTRRTFTIDVQAATAGTTTATLHDGTTATVPTSSIFPGTVTGANPGVTVPASGSSVEIGAFQAGGSADWAPNWRILEHELCGHARTGVGAGPIGNRPGHDATIDIENAIAGEHGGSPRGHFADRRQGESFLNPVGNRSKVVFFLTDGEHFEAP